MASWATVTVTDSTGKRYSLDVEADSTYDAAHLFLTHAKEHVIREPLPIPSLDTTFEVSVNGRVHKSPRRETAEVDLEATLRMARTTRRSLQQAPSAQSLSISWRNLVFQGHPEDPLVPYPCRVLVDYSVTIAALHPSDAPVRSGERSIFDTACPNIERSTEAVTLRRALLSTGQGQY